MDITLYEKYNKDKLNEVLNGGKKCIFTHYDLKYSQASSGQLGTLMSLQTERSRR